MHYSSLRYGRHERHVQVGQGSSESAERLDARKAFLKLCGFIQRKKVVILDSDPKRCAAVIASSDTKGTFIETLLATPAWSPIWSTESVDGDLWKELAKKFRLLMLKIHWRDRLQNISRKYFKRLQDEMNADSQKILASADFSKVTLRILYELVFFSEINLEDELLFYHASIEWRKEIGIKGRADPQLKAVFWKRLGEIFEASSLSQEVDPTRAGSELWLSTLAQPFLISPQINVSDIMVAVFDFLRADSQLLEKARGWVAANDRGRLSGVILEAIRLRHPFPILEREVAAGAKIMGETMERQTQFFILFDQFKQETQFDPERWLQSSEENPYHSLPFGVGPRMCAGKPIAMELMVDLLKVCLSQMPLERVRPEIGHLYSGRNNDGKEGWQGALYQLKMLLKALWKSFWIRNQSVGRSAVACPYAKFKR